MVFCRLSKIQNEIWKPLVNTQTESKSKSSKVLTNLVGSSWPWKQLQKRYIRKRWRNLLFLPWHGQIHICEIRTVYCEIPSVWRWPLYFSWWNHHFLMVNLCFSWWNPYFQCWNPSKSPGEADFLDAWRRIAPEIGDFVQKNRGMSNKNGEHTHTHT